MRFLMSKTVAVVLIYAALIIGATWYYGKNQSRVESGRTSVAACERIASQITQLRQAPQKIRLSTRSADDLGSVVEKAAADAQLARDRIVRIDPQPAKRVGKTDYLEQSTEVELLPASLRQLVSLLCSLASSGSDLNIYTLRLQAPHSTPGPNVPEAWSADIVLTQRIYEPTTPRR